MLRCVLLMALLGEAGFNAWGKRMAREPILPAIAGFSDGDAPGIGTLYDFMYRVLDGRPLADSSWQRPSARTRRRGRILRMRAASKRRPGRAQRAAERALSQLKRSTNEGFTHRLNCILMRCAVRTSVDLGLLGGRLDVAVDSSMLISHARKGGVLAADVEPTAGWIYERCADPDARFGYDSRVDGVVYGHRAHVAVARAGNRDLPIWFSVGDAAEPDSVHTPGLLGGLHRMLAEEETSARVAHVIADSAYDATALYRFVTHLDARPVIHLNPANVPAISQDAVERGADGVPICPAGAPMRLHQRSTTKGKSTYGCPAKRRKRDGRVVFHAERCPLGADCQPESNQGPWVHLHHDADPRMNPVVPRGSDEERRLFDKRTAAERVFGYMKGFGKLGKRPYRRRHIFHIVGLCHAIGLHTKAWLKAAFGKHPARTRAAVLACLSEVFAAAR